MAAVTVSDLRGAEEAFVRVQAELEALSANELAHMNVDVVSATSVALGVAERIRTFRERMALLPEFDVRHVDGLIDYALAAWYVYATNLPAPDREDATELLSEVNALRSKLLMWAAPLAGSGMFEPAAVEKIREGGGHKDALSDLLALVGLYRSKWDAVRGMCGVTESDLARAAEIAPTAFALVSRREQRVAGAAVDGALRVRRAWTLVDRAYAQCRRAIAYLRWEEGDVDVIAPNLRRNSGRSPAAGVEASAAPATPEPPAGGNPIGGSQNPFSAPN
jgi:hypothetical protein